MFNITYQHSLLGRRFVILTVLLSSVITLFFTIVQLTIEYDEELAQRALIKQVINESLLDSLSKSVWTYDDAQVNLQLQGIVNIPTVERVILKLPENIEFNIGTITSKNITNDIVEVKYTQEGKRIVVGTLTISSEMDSTYNHLFIFGSTMLFANLFKTGLVILFMLYLSDRLIGRHLMAISNSLAMYKESDKPKTIELDREKSNDSDEIDFLVDSINNMQQRIYFERYNAVNELHKKEEIQLEIVSQKEALLKLEHKVSVSEIVRSLANELNAPLINIKAFCRLSLEQMHKDTMEVKRLDLTVNKILDNSKHALDIVNRTSEIMKRSEPKRAVIEINPLLERACSLLSQELEQQNISLIHHNRDEIISIFADELQMEQVLMNLLRNAVEALSGSEFTNKEIQIAAKLNEEKIIITIEDNGPGINDILVEKIFKPFFSTKQNGLGIGLSISNTLVLSNSGVISVDLSKKQGACFNIELPLYNHRG